MTTKKNTNLLGKVKKKEGENLTPANIRKVIGLLEAEKPITKKEACEILCIAYNTTRLTKIIDEYKDEVERVALRKKANIGKPITNMEIQTIVENYLDKQPLKEIAERVYRPTSVVKKVIQAVGVPNTSSEFNYSNVGEVPEQCQSDIFRIGQLVWSMRYNAMALVTGEHEDYVNSAVRGTRYYKIYVIQPYEHQTKWFAPYSHGGSHAGSWAYDLASLDHLAKFGIDIYHYYRNLSGITKNPPPLGKEVVSISDVAINEYKKRPIRPTALMGNVQTPLSRGRPIPSYIRKNIIEAELCI